MSCRIEEISVQSLGPLTRFSLKPGRFNLIYGRNEKGKTFLVEFLVRSLFRNAAHWGLRAVHGRGRVRVACSDGRSHSFSPSSSRKLDDLWDADSGLPPDFSRLLVVKGAALELAPTESGVDRAILKQLLTGQGVLDEISAKIPKTLQKADIGLHVIHGEKKGDIKSREILSNHVDTVSQLFQQIDKGYSGAHRKILTEEKSVLEKRLDGLRRAKHHRAFLLDRQIRQHEREIGRIPEDRLAQARDTLVQYRMKIEEYKRKKKEQEATENRCLHYDWLSGAHEFYQSYLEKDPVRQPWIFMALSILFIAAAGVFSLLSMPLYALPALGLAVLLILLFFVHTRGQARRSAENREIEKLEAEFLTKFGEPLTGLPVLRERLFKMEEDYSKSRILKDQLHADLRQIESLKRRIAESVRDLTGDEKAPETWQKTLDDLFEKRRDIGDRLQRQREDLARLNVDTSDYESEDPGPEYSRETFDGLREDLESTNLRIREYDQKLETLKQRICQETGDSIATPWEILIQNLREIREQAVEEYKQKTAEILGKIIVNRVLQEFRFDEDSKLVEGLRSDPVLDAMRSLTHRYDRVSLNRDSLVVSDAYDDYSLSDLSTGAREQILLSLRIGFAQNLTKQDEPLFLILDDAFQHSDWERREWLMDAVVRLAGLGWQILYFTMDDHIRKLFEKKGKPFGEDCRIMELP